MKDLWIARKSSHMLRVKFAIAEFKYLVHVIKNAKMSYVVKYRNTVETPFKRWAYSFPLKELTYSLGLIWEGGQEEKDDSLSIHPSVSFEWAFMYFRCSHNANWLLLGTSGRDVSQKSLALFLLPWPPWQQRARKCVQRNGARTKDACHHSQQIQGENYHQAYHHQLTGFRP